MLTIVEDTEIQSIKACFMNLVLGRLTIGNGDKWKSDYRLKGRKELFLTFKRKKGKHFWGKPVLY